MIEQPLSWLSGFPQGQGNLARPYWKIFPSMLGGTSSHSPNERSELFSGTSLWHATGWHRCLQGENVLIGTRGLSVAWGKRKKNSNNSHQVCLQWKFWRGDSEVASSQGRRASRAENSFEQDIIEKFTESIRYLPIAAFLSPSSFYENLVLCPLITVVNCIIYDSAFSSTVRRKTNSAFKFMQMSPCSCMVLFSQSGEEVRGNAFPSTP